jgi:hypothetical protein
VEYSNLARGRMKNLFRLPHLAMRPQARGGSDVTKLRNETLGPIDWGSFRKQAHRMLDDN